MASQCRPDGPNRVSVMPDLKFGVELEITNMSRSRAMEAINAAGFRCSQGTYGHVATSMWNVTSDTTITGGCEVKSPILSGSQGLEDMVTIMELMKTIGATVNSSCGFHVHIDASTLKGLHLRRVLLLWAKHQKFIVWYAAPDRRDGRWCRDMGMHQGQQLFEFCPKRGTAINAARRVKSLCYVSRDSAVNIESLMKHGTIEFRSHEGTLDPEIAQSWVIFLLRLVQSCKEIRFGWADGVLERNIDSGRSLFQKVGLYPAWCYYRELDPAMSKAAHVFRKRYMKWCKQANVDPDPAEGKPGWKPRRMGG